MGKHLDYKQEIADDIAAKAKAEYRFSDRLYKILLAHQKGERVRGRHPEGIPLGNVGELNPELSRVYNLIWSAILNFDESVKAKKNKQQEVIAA